MTLSTRFPNALRFPPAVERAGKARAVRHPPDGAGDLCAGLAFREELARLADAYWPEGGTIELYWPEEGGVIPARFGVADPHPGASRLSLSRSAGEGFSPPVAALFEGSRSALAAAATAARRWVRGLCRH